MLVTTFGSDDLVGGPGHDVASFPERVWYTYLAISGRFGKWAIPAQQHERGT